MTLATIVAAVVAGAGLLWFAGGALAAVRGRRGEARARKCRRHKSWFRMYNVRVLGPELFRRWRPGKMLTHGYQRPAVVRSRAHPFSRSVNRLRHRHTRRGSGA